MSDWICSFCDKIFSESDVKDMILVDGSNSTAGHSLYLTHDKKGIHQLGKVRPDESGEEVTEVLQ